jgi:hypothetical protein
MKISIRTSRALYLVCLTTVLLLASARVSISRPQGTNSADIPVVKGGAGSCSADFVVSDVAGKGIYDAKIRIQIKYGFMGLHKLDLTVGTNYDGKARLEGLPERIKSTAEFAVSHGGDTKTLVYDPDDNCQSHQQVTFTGGSGPAK